MSIATPDIAKSPCAVTNRQPTSIFSHAVRDCRIVRLTAEDAASQSDSWSHLSSLIFQCEEQYPQIDRWMANKVRPGVEAGRRNVFLGYHQGKPAVAAIIKIGESAKICHLSVAPDLRGCNLGELFFVLMTMSVRHESKKLRFTLAEGLWERERRFFESFSFTHACPIDRQYRRSERELYCEAPFEYVWLQALEKLSKLRQAVSIDGNEWSQDLVLSVKPAFADKILNGTKTVEIRRSFSACRVPASCLLYSTSPVQRTVGTVDITRAAHLAPVDAWARFAPRIQCTSDQFAKYAEGASKVWALELANPRRYQTQLSLPFLRTCSSKPIVPPQSYSIISDGSGWANAMPVIALLQTACSIEGDAAQEPRW